MRTSVTALTTVLLTTLGPAVIAANAVTPPTLSPDNPFAVASALPYGLPPFDRIRDGDFMPAYQAGMAGQLAEVAAIVANPDPPTFENTVLALERSGRLLIASRVSSISHLECDDAMRQLETSWPRSGRAPMPSISIPDCLRVGHAVPGPCAPPPRCRVLPVAAAPAGEMVLAGQVAEPARRLRAYNAEIRR
jgi:hypothetical protein